MFWDLVLYKSAPTRICDEDNINMFVANRTVKSFQSQVGSDDIEQPKKRLKNEQKQEPEYFPNTFASANEEEETNWKKRCEKLTYLLTKSESECEELRKAMKRREELFNRIIKKTYRSGKLLKQRLKKVREESRKYDKLNVRLREIFNEDQIKALINPGSTCQWSDKTIKRAIRLRLACGSNGYQMILNENIPLPSYRTLRRKMNDVELSEDI